MKTTPTILSRVEAAMKIIAAGCLMGMALVTGADVLGRAALNTPIFGSEEIVAILATLAVGFSLPYAHSQKSHIGVELIYNRLSQKTRKWLKLTTDLAALSLFSVIFWRMLVYAATRRNAGVVSMNLELPDYVVIYALAGGFLVFTLLIAADMIRTLTGEKV